MGAALVAGCAKNDAEPVADMKPAASVATADAWLGRWLGPEGTYLDVAGANGVYEITIMNLDGARTFSGSATGDGIAFERDGVRETLRATNGDETGMKWLAGKANCLTVNVGEGYCRD
jgi:hypothetical protein